MATAAPPDRYLRDYYADDELSGEEMGVGELANESRCTSPTSSVYSYESSIDHERMLHEIHGRSFNNTSDYYMLPADPAEHCRLDLQHEMLKQTMGLFLRLDIAEGILAPRQTGIPAVLDVGFGSGAWTVDTARLFPHAEVVGIDLAPANLTCQPPPNCTFECDDVNLGLGRYHSSFDVINARAIASGIADYPSFLEDSIQTLRPGGMFQSIECDLQLFDEQLFPITAEYEDQSGFCWTQRLCVAAREAMGRRGSGIHAGPHIHRWMKGMDDVWAETEENVVYIPIGPWTNDHTERGRYIAELMCEDFFQFMNSVRPLLLTAGYFEETIDMWTNRIHTELNGLHQRLYIRVSIVLPYGANRVF
ncbi:hypothetical protein FRB90_005056 [Tulasnella sp. 427]|nr:hypothetical protein FRB90_005056 [Tulasnella sp. 427]